MISDKVDAIMINPASDTALNSVIEEACKQGIVVDRERLAIRTAASPPLVGLFVTVNGRFASSALHSSAPRGPADKTSDCRTTNEG
jgi:hypothetical protein